ncbi:MAG TPA: sigma-54 dependent transcriptional regulator [Acidobacteriaceae bacterium]|jgi:DNA-binding NtrC family response regulator|nr:sigma-54 dependent transcriptional regulator [Acidobacteriaceae bacterium]
MNTAAHSVFARAPRTAILTSADLSFRQRLRDALVDLRWQVVEASGGAETLACLDRAPAETVVLDSWLPDLEIQEFIAEFRRLHPDVDLILADASDVPGATTRGPRRNEVLLALRRAQTDGAIWNSAPDLTGGDHSLRAPEPARSQRSTLKEGVERLSAAAERTACGDGQVPLRRPLPEFVGSHPAMLEVSRRIRLAAPRKTTVLIEGPTGSGKELVALALHRLSPRAKNKLVALNCAAIPETLLEAELFGHARGAFTGAVQGRTGRIEAAHGGTLFLDEIGEMPLALQAKLLRFLETGELQRVGENEPVRVDVRIIAATHRPLARMAAEGAFRADLYYRLAVFAIHTPSLGSHMEDLDDMTLHFLHKLSAESPAKCLTERAWGRLREHSWPGNVRELEHVLERAWILAEDRPQIDAEEIELDALQ